MFEQICKILFSCFNVKKLDPICEICKKDLFNEIVIINTKSEQIKCFCDACAEKEYLLDF